MILRTQEVRVWGETPIDLQARMKWIELAGRTCYDSRDKIKGNSHIDFVENLTKRGHLSVLEHSNIVVRFPADKDTYTMYHSCKSVYDSPYIKVLVNCKNIYVGGNVRAFMELLKLPTVQSVKEYFLSLEGSEILDAKDIPNELKRITVEFVTDRASLAEITRHRTSSFSVQSQRYCAYRDDVTFINYNKLLPGYKTRHDYLNSLRSIEEVYQRLLADGTRPETARLILPNATATVIVMTADIPSWQHIFELRCSKAAWEPVRNLMERTQESFVNNGWI